MMQSVSHKSLLITKLPVLVALGVLAFLLNFEAIFVLYIVLGQAHFLLTYLYQWRAGKVRLNLFTIASYLALLLGLMWWVMNYTTVASPIIATLFMLHYYLDEFQLNGERLNRGRFMLALPLMALIALGLHAHGTMQDAFYAQHAAQLEPGPWMQGGEHHPKALEYFASLSGQEVLQAYWPWLWAGLVMVAAYFVFSLLKSKKLKLTSLHILVVSALIFVWIWYGGFATAIPANGLIVVAHIVHWYISMHDRLRKHAPAKLAPYYRDVFIVNALVIAGYAYTAYMPQAWGAAELGLYFFSFKAFFAWSAMHILTTVRVEDYKTVLGKLGEASAKGLKAFTRFE